MHERWLLVVESGKSGSQCSGQAQVHGGSADDGRLPRPRHVRQIVISWVLPLQRSFERECLFILYGELEQPLLPRWHSRNYLNPVIFTASDQWRLGLSLMSWQP